MKGKVSQSCLPLCNPIQSKEFSRPEYWSGSVSFLQGIFLTQGRLLTGRQTLYQLSLQGSSIVYKRHLL